MINYTQVLVDAANNVDGVKLYINYSGRGYTCFGIVSQKNTLNEEVVVRAINSLKVSESAAELLDFHSDQMGLDIIYYWPKLTCENLVLPANI